MAKFNLYRYSFEPIEHPVQTSTLVDKRLSLKEAYEQKTDLLWEFIMNDENIKAFRGARRKTYSTKTVLRENYIYVCHFANKKIHGFERAFNHLQHQEEPSCVVILDGRSDMQYIAVEKKSTAFTNTDTVAQSIQNTINRYLEPLFLRIEVRGEYRKNLLWRVISDYPRGIKMIRFNFPYPNMPEWTDKYEKFEKEYMKNLQGTLSRQYNGLDGRPLVLSKDDENITRWNSICEDSAKTVDVQPIGFKKVIHCNASLDGSQVEEDMLDDELEKITKDISTKEYSPCDMVSKFMLNHKRAAVDE